VVKKSSILFLFFVCTISAQERIKMYAGFSPSHKILFDKYFYPSIKDNFELNIFSMPQECESAKFMSVGWKNTTNKKVEIIIQAIKENMGKLIIWSDVDIVFFEPIEKILINLMGDYDLIIQKDYKKYVCSGFFMMRCNQKTLDLWYNVKDCMMHTVHSDQASLNKLLSNEKFNDIKWNYLPDEFYNPGIYSDEKDKKWLPGMEIPFPKNILIHHATYTYGVENKIAQLDYVIKKVNENKS
jgi:hypothetical protein